MLNEKRPTRVEIGLKRAVSVNLVPKKADAATVSFQLPTGKKKKKAKQLTQDGEKEDDVEGLLHREKGKEKEDRQVQRDLFNAKPSGRRKRALSVSNENHAQQQQEGSESLPSSAPDVPTRARTATTPTTTTTNISRRLTPVSPPKPADQPGTLIRTTSLPDVNHNNPTSPPVKKDIPSPRRPPTPILKRQGSEAWKKVEGMLVDVADYQLEGDEIVVVPIDTSRYSAVRMRKQKKTLKNAFKEFYRGLFLLVNFSELNGEGFDKAMKKLDKTVKTEQREKFMQKVRKKEFFQAKQLNILISETENLFCQAFFDNDRKGMKSLRMPWEKRSLGWSNFRLGFLSGLSLAVLFLIVYFGFILCKFSLFLYSFVSSIFSVLVLLFLFFFSFLG